MGNQHMANHITSLTLLLTVAFCYSFAVGPDRVLADNPITETAEETLDVAAETLGDAKEEISSLAKKVDADPSAKQISAGILSPIYGLAEHLSFPAFHWIAFALMSAGVVGFALQLVLSKLVLLTKMSFSFREILSDTLGLLISLVGLVLTTQAAAENSHFTQSSAAVISSTLVGILVGFILYRWGQSQEIEAAIGRRVKPMQIK
jgi:hypothetical protein